MRPITLLDGGMGSELRRIGAPFRQPEWSALALLDDPVAVIEAHSNFISAGAEVITTNNYAVVPYHLGDELFEQRGAELVGLAGRLARQTADAADEAGQHVQVAGSLPPIWGSYEPDLFEPELAPRLYAMIVEALDPWVDIWLAETLSTVAELDSIISAVDTAGSGQPLWASFCLPDRPDHHRVEIRSGEMVGDIVDLLLTFPGSVDGLLFNCSTPEQIGPAISALGAALEGVDLDLRIGGYANAFVNERGEEYAANEILLERRSDLTVDRYAEFVADWVDRGATIVGGCCGIQPEQIAELSRRFVLPP